MAVLAARGQMSVGDKFLATSIIGSQFTGTVIAETSLALGHEMIQMHGGMGVTDELAIGHYLKRALVIGAMLGGIDEDLRLLSEQPQRPWFGDTAPLERTLVQPNPATV